MDTPTTPSLLARARAYAQSAAGRATLAVTPLAVLGLSAPSTQAVTAFPSRTLDPATPTYGNDGKGNGQDNFFQKTGGTVTAAALPPSSNGFTGVGFAGSVAYSDGTRVSPNGAGGSGGAQQVVIFSAVGTASGTLLSADASLPVSYSIQAANTDPSGVVGFEGFFVSAALVTSAGSSQNDVFVPATGALAGSFNLDLSRLVGSTLQSYRVDVILDYQAQVPGVQGNNDTFSISQIGGADLVDIGPVPEPATWMGAAGLAGLVLLRLRRLPTGATPTV